MTKTKTFIALGLVLLVAAFFVLRYTNDFGRLKRVEVGVTPDQPGVLSKIVLTNNSSSKVEFPLRCYIGSRPRGKMLFSKTVVLPPHGSVEFDANPEFIGRELPRMVATKTCEAIWLGPFGRERSAWQVTWESLRVHKSLSN